MVKATHQSTDRVETGKVGMALFCLELHCLPVNYMLFLPLASLPTCGQQKWEKKRGKGLRNFPQMDWNITHGHSQIFQDSMVHSLRQYIISCGLNLICMLTMSLYLPSWPLPLSSSLLHPSTYVLTFLCLDILQHFKFNTSKLELFWSYDNSIFNWGTILFP